MEELQVKIKTILISIAIIAELRHHKRDKIEKTLFLRHKAGVWFIEAKNVVLGIGNIFCL